jgi:hypothetical protein
MGRKAVSRSTLGRATTAVRGVSRTIKESQDIGRAQETVEALHQQLAELEAQFQSETATLEARVDPSTERLETISLKPKKTDISVRLVALVWVPHWRSNDGSLSPAWG